ncbi:MAG TPA: hypothetical protein VJT09_19745, partial [Pyrinomonadaceae bacterium]|nr:hypothetical protein [Pyrinomonadaceae bacterium]
RENRRLASFPPVSLSAGALAAFPGKFKDYFNDNFGFRQTLIGWQAGLKVNWFGVSSSPRVILGKDGWLFFADEFTPEGGRAFPLFTEKQLEHWRRTLEARRSWLGQRGIRYLFVIAPSKQTIYPEHLPDSLIQMLRESRVNQLLAYLKERSDVEVVDLRPALYEAKSRRQLFPKTYSHWNFYAAFVAYQAVIRKLAHSFPQLQPVSESDCEITVKKVRDGDLAAMLGLSDSKKEETVIMGLLQPSYALMTVKELQANSIMDKPFKLSDKMEAIILNTYKLEYVAMEQKGTSLPRAVIFHDSSFVNTMPFFPQNFSRTVYRWTPILDLDIIKAERPDVVIQDMGEMLLMSPIPADAPEVMALAANAARKAAPGPGDKGTLTPDYNGFHDVADCNQVSGWAWDKNRPGAFLEVEIYDGETLLGIIPADVFRQDLVNAGIGDGEYGFSFALPPALKDGQPHSIRVKLAGTNFNLKGTPKTLRCAP